MVDFDAFFDLLHSSTPRMAGCAISPAFWTCSICDQTMRLRIEERRQIAAVQVECCRWLSR
jgi:hypothetical protein